MHFKAEQHFLSSHVYICLFQLALKHRQGKNHKMRIIAFVGSPVEDSEKDVSLSVSWHFAVNLFWGMSSHYSFHFNLFSFCLTPPCLCPTMLVWQLVKMAKRLKKEKVNVDIINFGEEVKTWFSWSLMQSDS